MRIPALLVVSLAATPAFAQYQYDLAPTRDGSELYFSYIDPAAGPNTKIYRWSHEAGVTLFGDRPDLERASPIHGQHLYGAQTTSGGTVLYHAEPLCSTGLGPGFNDCTVGETQVVTPNEQPFSMSGFLLVSPNGRYGVFAPYNNGGLWVDWFTGEQIEVDFHGQTIPNVSPPFSVNQHAVSNDGKFLITATAVAGVRIWSKNGETVVQTPDQVRNAAISADGGTLALTARDLDSNDPAIPTYVYDLPSGRRTRFTQLVSMSEDGQTVAYLNADPFSFSIPQAIVARSDGTGVRQITNTPDGVRSAVLSGDARYVYVVIGNQYSTVANRIQRYELATGAVEEIR